MHVLLFQKNSRHDNGLYVQPPITQSSDRISSEETATIELKDDPATVESSETASTLPEVTDNPDDEEDSANDPESIPYCVKTKPYYSINAKLNQRERMSVPAGTSAKGYVDKGYTEVMKEEITSIVVEDQVAQAAVTEDVKPPPPPPAAVMWDANLKFLGAPSRTSQTYNKSGVICLICGKQLSNQYNLRVHMETHSNSSYSCTACSHVSRSRDALRKHVSYRHPVSTPQKRPRYGASKP